MLSNRESMTPGFDDLTLDRHKALQCSVCHWPLRSHRLGCVSQENPAMQTLDEVGQKRAKQHFEDGRAAAEALAKSGVAIDEKLIKETIADKDDFFKAGFSVALPVDEVGL